ncbi:MAG TPA: hypothetical protein VKY85_11995 [Candidatus Angelobacter sp.]|nr:hypothetical protein [Candidatus Angelobacter sp.]
MPADQFLGSVFVLVLYDVSDEISLEELRPLVGGRILTPAFKHTTPGYVRFQRAPVVESVEPIKLETGEEFTATIQYYDYGVVGALLQHSYSGSWSNLQEVASRWISTAFFNELTSQMVQQRVKSVRPALRKPYENWLSEEYYIFHLHASAAVSTQELIRDHGQQISQLIDGETVPLAPAEQAEVMQASLSYYPNDLTVVGWNAAFIYDSESGAQPTIRILEYANSQLLQFRHYDELLTQELREGYRFLASRRGVLARWRMRPGASRLRAVLLEVTELTERTNHALKFVGDMFSARLYKLCASEIGVTEFQALVHDKLQTAGDLYDFMIDQFNQARGFLLESIVVIILIIELVFLFRGK